MSAIPRPPPGEPPTAADVADTASNPVLPARSAERMALLAALVESSDDAIISKNLDGRILSWNPSATRLFGYRPEEAIGRPITLIIPPELLHEEAHILARLRVGERIEHFETERVRKDGQRALISLTISPIRDSRGLVIAASKIARDITELRRAEPLRSQLAAIVESSDDAIVSMSLDGMVQSWNQGAVRMFGYQPQEAAGRHISFYIPPELQAEEEHILAQLRSGGHIDHYDTVRIAKDGRRVSVSLSISPIKDGRGKVMGAAKIARDVTQRKQLESALLESEQALRLADQRTDEFLALLAHELRNFLAPMSYALQIIRNREMPAAQHERAQQIIGRQVQHMGCLLDDLKEVTRIKRNALQLNKATAELTTILGSAIEAARPRLDEKHHVLSLDLPERAVRIQVDPTRMVQVFANLLINAAKYTDPRGRICLSARCEAGELCVTVRDNGIGITAEMLPRIFALFGQAPEAVTRSEGGLGIGLSLVKGVVELHGGRVEALSAGPGKGSEFRVHLPLDGGEADSAAAPAGLRALIVHGSEAAADELALFFTLGGHHPRSVGAIAAAQRHAAAFRPQVCVVDIGAFGRAAPEFARQVRDTPWGSQCLLIGLSEGLDVRERQSALEAGFTECIERPQSAEMLEALIARHLSGLRAPQ